MINQMQHAAATANMYASAGMYDPVTLNPYANGMFNHFINIYKKSGIDKGLINGYSRLKVPTTLGNRFKRFHYSDISNLGTFQFLISQFLLLQAKNLPLIEIVTLKHEVLYFID